MDQLMAVATGLISRESHRVEISANNITNAATAGYKRQISFQSSFQAQTSSAAAGISSAAGLATDFTPGKLQHTGNGLDLALTGPGFLQLAKDGQVAYARTASLHRTSDGHLATKQGWLLQAADGGDLRVTSDDWLVAPDATISEYGSIISTIAMVEFDSTDKLDRIGNGLFTATSTDPRKAHITAIQQGYLEASNVSVGNDMVQIMDAMRRIESGQKLVHVYDDMIGTALQRLGEM